MVDYFALALSHGLLALAVWRLMLRAELDSDPAPGPAPGEETPAAPSSPKRFPRA
jgi:hypothetical protein